MNTGTTREFSIRLRDCIAAIKNDHNPGNVPEVRTINKYADKYGIQREFVAKVCRVPRNSMI